MPMLVSTGGTANEAAICGSEVLMIAPSRFCMNIAAATIRAIRRAPDSRRGAADTACVIATVSASALSWSGLALVHPRALLQAGAIDRRQGDVKGIAVAVECQRDVDAGGPECPE